MTTYEVTVTLRFRSDTPIRYDDVRHRLQLSHMKNLAWFEVLGFPKEVPTDPLDAAMEAQTKIVDSIVNSFNRANGH